MQARVTLGQVAAYYNFPLPDDGSRREVRVACPFSCEQAQGGSDVAINTEKPHKPFYCHVYECHTRGNLLKLMFGMKHGRQPTGGRLTGAEFREIKADLEAIFSGERAPVAQPKQQQPSAQQSSAEPSKPTVNVPLADAENAKARELLVPFPIDQKLVHDIEQMSPPVSRYVRQRRYLSPEVQQKWRMGYMPSDGGGDKRGMSLRGRIIYTFLSETGKELCYVGRDVQHDEKLQAWQALPDDQRRKKRKPEKHHFPSGFQRGLELFGQQASRLDEPEYRKRLAQHGVVLVEGFNDVIALDALGQPAVGLCSNTMTEAQADKVTRFAKAVGGNRVVLMLDAEPTGDDGAKSAAWSLLQRGVEVRAAWSQSMHGGQFAGRQPESLTGEELQFLLQATTEKLSQ